MRYRVTELESEVRTSAACGNLYSECRLRAVAFLRGCGVFEHSVTWANTKASRSVASVCVLGRVLVAILRGQHGIAALYK